MNFMLFQLILLLTLFNPGAAQPVPGESPRGINDYVPIEWKDLARIDFEYKYHPDFEREIPYPIFHKSVKALQGKKIKISGYAIPLEESAEKTVIVLSAFPFSACFFCGGAGPESVMDIKPKGEMKRLDMDHRITLKGTLELNRDDLYSLYYILQDAEIVK